MEDNKKTESRPPNSRFAEDGEPKLKGKKTFKYDHLGKKVNVTIEGLEQLPLLKLNDIIQEFLTNGEVPNQKVEDEYTDLLGIKKRENGEWDIVKANFEQMSVNKLPYYKVSDFSILSKETNFLAAIDRIRIEVSKHIIDKYRR